MSRDPAEPPLTARSFAGKNQYPAKSSGLYLPSELGFPVFLYFYLSM